MQTEANRFIAADRLKLGRPEINDIVNVREAIRFQSFESVFAWNARGRLVAARDGVSLRVDLFDAELQQTMGGVLLHNHPNQLTFSLNDVNIARTFQIARLEIVTQKCLYMLEPPDRGWWFIGDAIWERELRELNRQREKILEDRRYGRISVKEVLEAFHEAMSDFRANIHARYGRIEG